MAARTRAILGHTCPIVAEFLHVPQIGNAPKMAIHTVHPARPASLCTVVIHPFLQPAGSTGVGRRSMAGGAIQPRCDRRRNVVGYLGLCATILQSLRRVRAVMAYIAAYSGNLRVLHGSRQECGDSTAKCCVAVTA